MRYRHRYLAATIDGKWIAARNVRSRRRLTDKGTCSVAACMIDIFVCIETQVAWWFYTHALAIDHKNFQALSAERLRGLFRDAVGLAMSKGARFTIEAQKAQALLRAARVVAGAETGVRIEGTNA